MCVLERAIERRRIYTRQSSENERRSRKGKVQIRPLEGNTLQEFIILLFTTVIILNEIA